MGRGWAYGRPARAEHDVFQRFAELTKGKPGVLTSHCVGVVRVADCILAVENGQFVGVSAPETWLAKGNRSAERFALQALDAGRVCFLGRGT